MNMNMNKLNYENADAELTVTVDFGNIISDTTQFGNGIGFCLSFPTDSDIHFAGERRLTMLDLVRDYNIATLRWPMGTASQAYLWNTMDNNGQFRYPIKSGVSTLSRSPADFSFKPVDRNGIYTGGDMDFDEFLGLCKQTGAVPVICLPFCTDLYADSLITLEDLYKTIREQVRYAAKEKGMSGMYWEVGNEIELELRKNLSEDPAEGVAWYIERYNVIYEIIKAEDPAAKAGPGVYLFYEGTQGYRNWGEPIINALRDRMDFVVNHMYGSPQKYWNQHKMTYAEFRSLGNDSPIYHNRVLVQILDALGEPYRSRIEIIVTEFSGHRDRGWEVRGNNMQTALLNSVMIADMLAEPRITQAHFWLTRSPWGDSLKNTDMNNAHTALHWDGTPTAMGMSVLSAARHMTGKLAGTVSSDPIINAYTSVNDTAGAATVLMINRDLEPVRVRVILNNNSIAATAAAVYVFKAMNGSPYDYDYRYIKTAPAAIENNTFEAVLPPISATFAEIGTSGRNLPEIPAGSTANPPPPLL